VTSTAAKSEACFPRVDTALVLLTDPLYLSGTLLLASSFSQQNGALPIIVLSKSRELLEDSRIRNLATVRHLVEPAHYHDIPVYKKRRSKRHAATFLKFEAFRDFGYAQNLYLDSDLLCLRPAPKLLRASGAPLAAAADSGFRATRRYKGHKPEINTGVLRIDRELQGESTVSALLKIARDEPGAGGYNAGDQSVINKWIHRNKIQVDMLPPEYNLIKKDYADTASLASCRLLHFCARKPWFPSKAPMQALERLWRQNASEQGLQVHL